MRISLILYLSNVYAISSIEYNKENILTVLLLLLFLLIQLALSVLDRVFEMRCFSASGIHFLSKHTHTINTQTLTSTCFLLALSIVRHKVSDHTSNRVNWSLKDVFVNWLIFGYLVNFWFIVVIPWLLNVKLYSIFV